MISCYFSLCRIVTVIWAVGIAISVAGCGRTLVFAEREGVNLAVRANPSATPPLGVNFGLERVVMTIVPPAGQMDGKPAGEAVNMFAAFQVDSTGINIPKPLDVDLSIDTQFASGVAAKFVAGNPTVVAKIVNVAGTTFQRGPDFVDSLEARRKLVATISGLSDDQVIVAATSMLPNLSARPDSLRKALAPQVEAIRPGGKMPPAMARNLLNQWAALETITPGTIAEWATAFAQAEP